MRLMMAVLAAFLCSASFGATDYTIVTVAGNGAEGFGGDGGDARCAQLNRPTGVDVDSKGFIYIADYSNHRVRRVSPDGVITTVAGTGVAGFSGDGGLATSAQLSGPYGVRVVEDGFLIADARNGRIRHVNAAGIIRTIVGGGTGESIGDGGPATSARLQHPVDVIVGPDRALYVAEGGGNRVRRIDPAGSIDTYAGSGRLRYTGQGFRAGDGGPAKDAVLNVPAALAFDGEGNLFIGDLGNDVVRRVARDGTISTVATGIDEAGGLAFERDGNLLISSLTRIHRLAKDGTLTVVAGADKRGFAGDHGPAAKAEFAVLDLIAIDKDGNVFAADHRNARIRKLSPVTTTAAAAPAARKPASDDVEALLAKMRNAYQSLPRAELTFAIQRDRRALKGELVYEKPSVLRGSLDVDSYGKVSITSDGKSITIADPMLPSPEVLPWSAAAARRALVGNLELASLWDSERQLSTGANGAMRGEDLAIAAPEKWRGRTWTILEEKSGALLYRYFIDPKTFLMWRTVATDGGRLFFDGSITTLRTSGR